MTSPFHFFIQSVLFCTSCCSCMFNAHAQNIWRLYYNKKEIQIRNYTNKGRLRYLVQNDDDGDNVDSVIYKKRIRVYSYTNNKWNRNSNYRVIDFYTKFKSRKGTFLSPYVENDLLTEEYIYDIQSIYDFFLFNGDYPADYVSISKSSDYTKISFHDLNCRADLWYSPITLQSYLFDHLIKDIEVYVISGKLSKIIYTTDKNTLNVIFSYWRNTMKILIEALHLDGKKEEYVYEWKGRSTKVNSE